MSNLIIHRGTKEIGGNCIEVSTNSTRVLFDFGMPLVEADKSEFNFNKYKSLSVDELIKKKILPNMDGLYPNDKNPIDAIIISHPHMDHYGFMGFVSDKIPVYIGNAANELIKISNIFTPSNVVINNPIFYNSEKPFTVGDITITPYLNDHSAFDAYSFLIEGEGQRLFYSGDFRGHGRKGSLLTKLANHPPPDIDYLLMEGTNIGRTTKSKSEDEIENELTTVFKESDKINLIYQAGQNIDRIVSVFKACKKANKTLVLDIYLAYIMATLVKTTGNKLPYPSRKFPQIKVFFSSYASKRMVIELGKQELYNFQPYKITKDEIDKNFSNIVMIVRPSLMVHLKGLKNIDNGNLIYSLWEGYKTKGSTKTFIEHLINDRKFTYHYIHTSGHADLDTLKDLVNGINPNKLIPIHTFKKDEYNKLFNKSVIKIKDGELFQC